MKKKITTELVHMGVAMVLKVSPFAPE